jgi:hypothetical protein
LWYNFVLNKPSDICLNTLEHCFEIIWLLHTQNRINSSKPKLNILFAQYLYLYYWPKNPWNYLFLGNLKGNFFLPPTQMEATLCSQDLNLDNELSSQWIYHCTMSPFAIPRTILHPVSFHSASCGTLRLERCRILSVRMGNSISESSGNSQLHGWSSSSPATITSSK